jgi:outer membrane receptor for ferrienterochelin and colicins
MRCIATILFLLFCACSSFAQAQNVLIQVTDTANVPIQGATVSIFSQNKFNSYVSDAQGMVIVVLTKTGIMQVKSIGYASVENIKLNTADSFKKVMLLRTNALLNEVVITGGAREINADNSIYKVNAINSNTLNQQAVNNLAEALQQQSNIYIQQDNLLGSNLNLQGIGGQNVKILVNGAPINGRENGNIDLRQINLNNAERVEIIKGPMSTLYGTDAMGGVINIITKSTTAKSKLLVQQTVESISRFNTNIQTGFNKKRHSFTLGATRDIFLGYAFQDTFSRSQLWKPNELLSADVQYHYIMRKARFKYMPSFSRQHVLNLGAPSVDPFNASAIDEHYFTTRLINIAQLDYDIDSSRKLAFTMSHSYYNRVRRRMYKDLTTLSEIPTTNRGDQDTARFNDLNFRGVFSTDWDETVHLLAGVEIAHQDAASERLIDKQKQFTEVALFATMPFYLNKNIEIQPAVRISYNTIFQVPALPSMHVRYQVNKNVIMRASFAQGFRAPSLKERYLYYVDQNHNVQGNDTLKPEKGNHIQMHWDVSNIKVGTRKIKFTSATYFNSINNQIVLALTNPAINAYSYANVQEFKNLCQELQVKTSIKNWNIMLGSSFNYLFTADSGAGYMNKEANAQVQYNYTKRKASLNIFYRYIHKQALLSISDLTQEAAYSSFLPPTNWLDINVNKYAFKNKLNLQIGARNLFNIGALPIVGAPLQGNHGSSNTQLVGMARNYFVRVGWNF